MVCRQRNCQSIPRHEECGRILSRCTNECHPGTIYNERGAAFRVRGHPTIHRFRRSRETFPTCIWFDRVWPVFWSIVLFLPRDNYRRFRGFRERGKPPWLLSALVWPNRVRAVITAINLRSRSDTQRIWTAPNTRLRASKPTIGFRPNRSVIVLETTVFWSACIWPIVRRRDLRRRFRRFPEQQHQLWFSIFVAGAPSVR
jgi:hypothetical protein